MASASAYGNCGAADIVSNHASMHKMAAVAAAAGLVAPVLAPDQMCDAQQAHCLQDVEADPGSAEAALARVPVQLLDQYPGPRHEQDAAASEHPCQYTIPAHNPIPY